MRRLLLIVGLWVAATVATVAIAQDISIIRGTSATNYALDGQGVTTGAYSLRRLLTSYSTNKLINIRRTSDSTTTDIGRTATGAIDTSAATTFCAATTCFVATLYDQSGGGRDLVQATAGNQPQLIFNCLGSWPCIQSTTNTQLLTAAGNVTPATGLVSFSAVAERTAGTASCQFIRENGVGNRLQARNIADNWQLTGGASGNVNLVGGTDNFWHAAVAVMNGASSVINVDGTEVTGTATGSTTAAPPSIGGASASTCNSIEGVFWDNVTVPAASRTMLINNMRAWWGF